MPTSEPQQLLHISHARQDEAWVQGTLLPALGLATGEYWTREEDEPGAPRLAELSRAVRACRYTLLVASRAAAVNAWTTFAGEIAGQLGLEEGKPRLLVIALGFAPGSEAAKEILSLEQRALACFDCRDTERTPAALAALAATLALAARPSPPVECPYPGLRMFGEGDPATMFQRTDLFFGRDAEGRGLVDQLRATRRALVVGPSGCGKSSLVRARVLPTLTTGDRAMALVAARPGPAPGRALRDAVDAVDRQLTAAIEAYLKDRDQAALAAAAGGLARLIYLDQLEEVFAAPADARAEMFAWLAALGEVPGVAILLGMRTDFYDDLMRSPSWDSFKDHRVELSPLRGVGLREAITRPAEAVGVHVEVDLVERLVREAEADRAAEALPLLQVALEQLWAQRAWRYLSLDSYARLAGDTSTDARRGLDVVFARHADATIEGLAEPARVVARRMLIDLVHFGDGRPSTRRRRTEVELRRAGDDEAVLRAVLDRLATRRLVVVGAELTATVRHVDLAHDALITGWPALAGWIRDRRDRLVTQRRMEQRAAAGGLLARAELPEYVAWLEWTATPPGQALGASEAMRVLVRRSQAARARVRAALITFMVSLTVAAGIATWQWRVAVANATLATQREAAKQRILTMSTRLATDYTAVVPDMFGAAALPPEARALMRDRAYDRFTEALTVFIAEHVDRDPRSNEFCLMVRMSYELYAIRQVRNDPDAVDAVRPYEARITQSGARCGAHEFLDEALGADALAHDRFAEAEQLYRRAIEGIEGERAPNNPEPLRINLLVRREFDVYWVAMAAFRGGALDRARDALADVQRGLAELADEAVRLPALVPTVATIRNGVAELARAIDAASHAAAPAPHVSSGSSTP